jgi:uncharacterized protein (TIGR02284 family)
MATERGLERRLIHLLDHLIEVDFDAIEAYAAAIARLEQLADRDRLRDFMVEHQAHVRALSLLVRDLGARPPGGPDLKRLFTRGKVLLAGLVDERAVLFAMKRNEQASAAAYARAAAHSALPTHLREVIARHLTDESHHHAWFAHRLVEPTHAPVR